MKVPVSWLREYVEVSATAQQIADRLAIATGEVERITRESTDETMGDMLKEFTARLHQLVKGVMADPKFLERLILQVAGRAGSDVKAAEILLPGVIEILFILLSPD